MYQRFFGIGKEFYRIAEPKSEEEMAGVLRLRCSVVCDEDGFKERESFPDGLEKDRYDDYSDYLAIFDDSDSAAACIRIVHHSPVGYPMEEIFGPVIERLPHPKEACGEVSRFFIRQDCRNLAFTHLFFEAVKEWYCQKSVQIGVYWTVSAVEETFLKLLNRHGYPFRKFGEGKRYAGKIRFPALLSQKELCYEQQIKRVRHENAQ
ncbi:MAG: GNAT family N-acetyltransferase [Epsilonproteobacteria bacterium]|nr:GNAT family N-acetyltransferase [Campylobacterota bacterium]